MVIGAGDTGQWPMAEERRPPPLPRRRAPRAVVRRPSAAVVPATEERGNFRYRGLNGMAVSNPSKTMT